MKQAFKNGEQVLQKGDIEAGKLDTANKKAIRSDRTIILVRLSTQQVDY